MFLRNNRNLRSQDKALPQNLGRQANTENHSQGQLTWSIS